VQTVRWPRNCGFLGSRGGPSRERRSSSGGAAPTATFAYSGDNGLKDGQTVDSMVKVNLLNGLTGTSAYYTYGESLTTPPCSENVTWIVLKEPAEMSAAQFNAFDRILGNDFRPLQDRNGRVVRPTPNRGKGRAR
jgi:hypothetical protein